MHNNYEDIRSRIEEDPTWYDQNGVPRYGQFIPTFCPSIYSDAVALLQIACQYCHETFDVEMHRPIWNFGRPWIPKKLHYGDPPVHGCVGDTMNCEDLEVLEVWERSALHGAWTRRPELEGMVDD